MGKKAVPLLVALLALGGIFLFRAGLVTAPPLPKAPVLDPAAPPQAPDVSVPTRDPVSDPPPPASVPGLEIRGRVLDEAGRGVAGARLWLQSAESEEQGWEQITRAEGSFHFRGLPSHLFRLSLSATGYIGLVLREGPTAHPAPAPPLTYTMVKGWGLSGVVLGEDGRPVPGARIEVREGSSDYVTLTDKSGAFQLGGIDPRIPARQTAPGIDELRCRARGFAPKGMRDIAPGSHLTLLLGAPGTMVITVRVGGAPAEKAFSWTAHRKQILNGEVVEPGNVTLAEGPQTRIEDLQPGLYELTVASPGYLPSVSRVDLLPRVPLPLTIDLTAGKAPLPDLTQMTLKDGPAFRSRVNEIFDTLSEEEKALLKEQVRSIFLGKKPLRPLREDEKSALDYFLNHP